MTLDYTILMVSYRLVQDYIAIKLADCMAVNLISLEIHLVGWPLADLINFPCLNSMVSAHIKTIDGDPG
jgi:hypothetical protein